MKIKIIVNLKIKTNSFFFNLYNHQYKPKENLEFMNDYNYLIVELRQKQPQHHNHRRLHH